MRQVVTFLAINELEYLIKSQVAFDNHNYVVISLLLSTFSSKHKS